MKHTLAPKVRKFVEFFVRGQGNRAQAAIDAGYSPKSAAQRASQLLHDPLVLFEIESRRLSKEIGAEATYRSLKRLAQIAIDKADATQESADIETARRCLDTLAHIEGMYVERLQVSGNVEHRHSLSDLARRASEYQARLARDEGETVHELEHQENVVLERIEHNSAVVLPSEASQEQVSGQ